MTTIGGEDDDENVNDNGNKTTTKTPTPTARRQPATGITSIHPKNLQFLPGPSATPFFFHNCQIRETKSKSKSKPVVSLPSPSQTTVLLIHYWTIMTIRRDNEDGNEETTASDTSIAYHLQNQSHSVPSPLSTPFLYDSSSDADDDYEISPRRREDDDDEEDEETTTSTSAELTLPPSPYPTSFDWIWDMGSGIWMDVDLPRGLPERRGLSNVQLMMYYGLGIADWG